PKNGYYTNSCVHCYGYIIVAQQYVISNSDLVMCDTVKFQNSEKRVSCGIAKGSDDFVKLVNDVIKECQDDGKFDEWIEEYSKQAAKEAAN
ncbi:MAG: hypothetical protein ACI4HI_00700, partial [Lachnospiraceae bacterium]